MGNDVSHGEESSLPDAIAVADIVADAVADSDATADDIHLKDVLCPHRSVIELPPVTREEHEREVTAMSDLTKKLGRMLELLLGKEKMETMTKMSDSKDNELEVLRAILKLTNTMVRM